MESQINKLSRSEFLHLSNNFYICHFWPRSRPAPSVATICGAITSLIPYVSLFVSFVCLRHARVTICRPSGSLPLSLSLSSSLALALSLLHVLFQWLSIDFVVCIFQNCKWKKRREVIMFPPKPQVPRVATMTPCTLYLSSLHWCSLNGFIEILIQINLKVLLTIHNYKVA